MNLQTITRQALLEKIISIVNNLPAEKLQQTWEQVERWNLDDPEQADANNVAATEIIEFAVPSRPNAPVQFVRLPIYSRQPVARAIMESVDPPYTTSNFTRRLQANIEWWNQHFDKIYADPSLYNTYVAVSEGLVFSGESYLDAYEKARSVHSDDIPYIFFLKSPDSIMNHAH